MENLGAGILAELRAAPQMSLGARILYLRLQPKDLADDQRTEFKKAFENAVDQLQAAGTVSVEIVRISMFSRNAFVVIKLIKDVIQGN